MSGLLKKSIIKRLFYYFALFAAAILAIITGFFLNDLNEINIYVFGAALLIFLMYFVWVYYREVVFPLEVILEQMKALLTGKDYKKIYTRRMDEIGIIAHFFNEVTRSFEKVSMDIKEGKRMLNELEIAAQLQADILPKASPKVKGLLVEAKTRPAAELGGDNFDFIKRKENTFIYIGDVTGHGVPAGLVMTMVNTLIHTFVEIYDNAYDIIVNTNKQLKSRIKSTMFMTMVLLKWNEMSNKMTFVGSGHEHIIIYRASSGTCETVKSGGIALGMVPDNSKLVKEKELPLNEGDVLVLYSDGITEGRNMSGEMYTLERLLKAVEKFATEYDPDGIVHHIALDYSKFVQNHVQDDDVTLMVIKYVGNTGKEKASISSTKWSDEQ
ncbi:SpoIIE family protein phosphatase [Candidatus Peregrinibacteria bacterium]|nr:SpoIIE family protein phosphatase [Candidatus Peregrinibacteria bacterium]